MQAVSIRENFSTQVMEDLQNGVMVIGRTGGIVYTNASMRRYLEIENAPAESIAAMMAANSRSENDAFFESILDVVYNKTTHHQTKVKYTTPSGSRYSFHMTTSFLEGEDGGVVITLADETIQENAIQDKHDALLGLVGAILILCLTNLAFGYHQTFGNPFPVGMITHLIEFLGLVLMVVMLRFSRFSAKDMGLKPLNLRRELKETLLIAAGLILFLSVFKWGMLRFGLGPFKAGAPFFDFAKPGANYIQYLFVALVQEFIANCVMQENLNRLLTVKHGKLLALIISSFMFMGLHVHLKLVFMLGAGVLKFLLGILYNRHRSIIGVTLLHYIFGTVGSILQWT